jgi:hypothetical protein
MPEKQTKSACAPFLLFSPFSSPFPPLFPPFPPGTEKITPQLHPFAVPLPLCQFETIETIETIETKLKQLKQFETKLKQIETACSVCRLGATRNVVFCKKLTEIGILSPYFRHPVCIKLNSLSIEVIMTDFYIVFAEIM